MEDSMKPIPQAKQSSYRPEIDGIRAFAVTAVIINHFNKEILPSGYLGVDIFFVISGFVITSSLASRPSKNFRDFLAGFYTRRIKRLVPVLVLFVLVTSILICLFNPTPDASLKTGIASLFGLSNLYLLRQSTDYFAASTELNVFTHTWSLGVEEQFYFLFPFLVWFTGFGRLATQGSRNLFWVMGVLSVTSLIAFIYSYKTNQPAAYFLMPTRLWEMGAGCLLFLSLKHFNRFFRTLDKVPPLIVTGAVVAVLFVPLQFAVQATFAIVVLTAVLITCLRSGTAVYNLFTHPRVVYIGLISYSLYLWHWGVLSLSRWTIGIHWWSILLQLALMLLLSIASYRYVETPLRRSDWSVARWKSIGYGLGASAISAVLLFSLTKIPNLYTGQSPSLVAVGVHSLTNMYSLKQVNSLWRGDKCLLSNNSQVGKKILVEDCTLGSFSNAKKRVVVLGNSFSTAFTQAFDDLVVLDGYSVTITSSWGASPVKEIPNNTTWDKANYYYWESVVPSLLNRLRPGDWVFLINDMAEFSPKYRTSETNEMLKQLESGLDALSGQLSARGIQLAILHGLPFAREAHCQPVIAAKQWFHIFGGPCQLPSRRESLLRRDNLNKVLVSLEAEGKLHIVDIFDVFCPEEQCTYNARNGQILYRDEFSHPSVEAARLSSPIIRKVLTSS
ncbi:acyltransferase family protein [Microcystis aeruginosa CS-564/01]|uniref:acyltransferase family protein n=1 Tax=Microcystis aeruginosa TaxID=1126 RepID=UPI00232FC2E1|nr:acyltransferase family protein [Microcystis aeruginosa]MDB9425215.1 acyltransferase family protein [Microcystis aeruginosa CS-564/01]